MLQHPEHTPPNSIRISFYLVKPKGETDLFCAIYNNFRVAENALKIVSCMMNIKDEAGLLNPAKALSLGKFS